MVEENIDQELKLKNINETRTYFIEESNQNDLIIEKHDKFCIAFNYI